MRPMYDQVGTEMPPFCKHKLCLGFRPQQSLLILWKCLRTMNPMQVSNKLKLLRCAQPKPFKNLLKMRSAFHSGFRKRFLLGAPVSYTDAG